MKKLKYFLFIFILFLTPKVFADITYDMTSRITSPVNFSECGNGSYTGIELNGASNCWNTNERYQGTLSRVYFNLPAPSGSTFDADTSYRLSLYMATNDWRNRFGSVVVSPGSSYTNNFIDSFTFVSKKQINITFTVPYSSSTTYQTLYVNLPATNINTLITGESNWNLSKVTLTKLTSGSGGGSTTPSGPSTSFDDTGIINNANENTQDIINNNNTNTQDIINNNNENTQDIIDNQKELLGSKCTNLIDIPDLSLNKDNNRTYDYILPTTLSSGTYTLTYNYSSSGSPNTYVQVLLQGSSGALVDLTLNSIGKNTFTINNSFNRFYILISSDSPSGSSVNLSDIMLTKGSLFALYCKYGSTLSKLDDVNNNINASTGAINGAINGGISNVINNQNSNTDKEIDSQYVCKSYDNTFKNSPGYLSSTGSVISNSTGNYFISDFIPIYSTSKLKLSTTSESALHTCFYTSNMTKISCFGQSSYELNTLIPIPDNAAYIKYSMNIRTNRPVYSICNNGNQSMNDTLTDTNNFLKDDSDPTISNSALNDVFGRVHFTDPLSYLLTLPTQLINKIVSLSDTCSAIDLGTLYGVHLTLPCINLENYLGSDLWSILDIILSVGLLSVILKNFYDTISNLLTLGGEKEAKEKFSMPTPMDFLAMILGGDRQ